MDPIAAVGGGLAIFGSKDLIVKLLGPTADYLGGELRYYTEKGIKNVQRVFDNGIRKAGHRLNEPGQVAPKVLKNLLAESYFCEDELGAEYFGGVLAASRTGVSRDDRGAAIVSLIGRLSSYQLRAHYLFYTALRQVYGGSSSELARGNEREKLQVFFPGKAFAKAMDFEAPENVGALVPHIMNGLAREELISENWAAGQPTLVKEHFGFEVAEQGIVFAPAAGGVELYCWAHGCGDRVLNEFLKPDVSFESLAGLEAPEGVVKPHTPTG